MKTLCFYTLVVLAMPVVCMALLIALILITPQKREVWTYDVPAL